MSGILKYGTLKNKEGNKIYPNAYYKIGDIFITTNDENPSDRFGGTWEKLPNETFLMTASDSYAVKTTGGENEHTLTIEEIPSHTHTAKIRNSVASGTNGYTADASGSGGVNINNNTGGGQPHNNMPKFYTIYAWIRVS